MGLFEQATDLETLSLDFMSWRGLVDDHELAALGKALMELPKLRQLSLICPNVDRSLRGFVTLVCCLRKATTPEHLSIHNLGSKPLRIVAQNEGIGIGSKLAKLEMDISRFTQGSEEDASDLGSMTLEEEVNTNDVAAAKSGAVCSQRVSLLHKDLGIPASGLNLHVCEHLSQWDLLLQWSDLDDTRLESPGLAVSRLQELSILRIEIF